MLKLLLKLLGLGGVDRNILINSKKRIDPTMGVGPLPDEAGKMKVIGDHLWRRDPGGTWVIVAAWPHKVMRPEDLPSISPEGAYFDIGDDRWSYHGGAWVKLGAMNNNGQFMTRMRQPAPRLPARRTPYPVSPSRQREDDNMMNALAAMSAFSMNSGDHHRSSNHDDNSRHCSPTYHTPSSHSDHGSYDSSPSDNSSPSCD